jgi:DHA1 family bicyclomycin/chloramphenicol resistance-like MFS transporter
LLEPPAPRRDAGRLSTARLGPVLGLLSVIGPLSIDLYLPALPRMGADLHASAGSIQRTLSVFFLALAAAQIPIGSFGDRFGRKLPLYLGLSLFVAASLGCAAAPGVRALIALRFVQGFGVCAGTAVSRAIIRDLRQGPDAARLMAVTFLVIGVSPVLAPLAGSALLQLMPWRGLFVVLAGTGLAGLLLARWLVPESLPVERRLPRNLPVLPAYAALLRNPRFLVGAAVAGLATTIPYAYLTAAPFVFTRGFGLTPGQYSLALAVNGMCSITTTQFSPRLMRRWGPQRLIARLAGAGVVLIGAELALSLSGPGTLASFQLFSMLLFALAGLILTPAAVSAMDAGVQSPGAGAGAAAGALGTVQLVVTALASAAISVSPAFSLLPLLLVCGASVVLSGLLALALGLVSTGTRDRGLATVRDRV